MTDWQIVTNVLSGKRESYALLVDRYKKAIFNLAFRFTHNYSEAQDLSQEIFVQAFLQLEKFTYDSQFFTWLYRLAINKCIDWQRNNKRQPEFLELEENFNKNDNTNPEECILQKEKELWLKEVLDNMPEKYRIVIILFHFQGLSYTKISEALQIPVKTVETRLYRGRKILKERLCSGLGVDNGELSTYRT